MDADDGLKRLEAIETEFAEFCAEHGRVSESDTRAKVIDTILREVLGWPEGAISREDRVESGYADYVLSHAGRRTVVVEAKREGETFTLPTGPSRTLKVSGALSTDASVRDAVAQVRSYCDDAGIRHAIATNGYAWIVFRAIRDDMPWRDGRARVFASLEAIRHQFTEFWNLLSYEAVSSGSLETEFGAQHRPTRRLDRVVDGLYDADLPLQRNRYHAQLAPVLQSIFTEIADQDQVEVLSNCYVHSSSLRIVADDLDCVIVDSVPQFMKDEGAVNISLGADEGPLGAVVKRAIDEPSGELFLILGGIGAGKTTFLKRYRRTVGQELLDSRTLWFNIDFLQAPLDPRDLEDFVLGEVLTQLRSRYVKPHLESRHNIRRVFHDRIEVLRETGLRQAYEAGPKQFENALDPYLEEWSGDLTEYVPGLLKLCKPRRDLAVVLFVDNVDQLPPTYQAQIFLLAERLTRRIGCVTIVSLREESYYAAGVQKTFTAYSTRKFHIASPQFRRVVESRITYALNVLARDDEGVRLIIPGGIEFDRQSIHDFLVIVNRSIFQRNRTISTFIDAICFGNTRRALQMFSLFLTSGVTDVDKMLLIFRRDGAYYVAFHEFVKSVMLGDRKYYREEQSPLLNLFDCGAQRNSSHFTALRLVNALAARRGEATPQGQGYVGIASLIAESEEIFDNYEDVVRCLNRLVSRQLVELNTRSTESIDGAEFIRLTSAGWYYRRYLVEEFSYLDLVLQDTPIDDEEVWASLVASVKKVDNMSDRAEEKLVRMEVRFDRVDRFLRYLLAQESVEVEERRLDAFSSPMAEPLVPRLIRSFEEQRDRISRRLKENREHQEDDTVEEQLEVPGSGDERLFDVADVES